MKDIRITYIDDEIDTSLSKSLAMEYGEKNYAEYEFNCQNGYEDLLNAQHVRDANVIIIDSKLFDDGCVHDKKFTGEEFKIILKKILPFVEVLVITQNDEDEKEQIISKYKHHFNIKSADVYYKECLFPHIDKAVKNIEAYRRIAEKLAKNTDVDKMLVDKINNSLKGLCVYDELKSSQVDELIKAFEELKNSIDE